MKGLSLTIGLLMLISVASNGQHFKSFRVILGGGYATGSGYASGGIFGTLEPSYRITDQVAVGLRGELAGIARGSLNGLSVDVDISAVRSTTLNAIYYFPGDYVRPFAGFGGGRYVLSAFGYKVGVSGPEEKRGKESKLGFYPRVGIELGHLGFTIDYNIIPKTVLPDGNEFKNNYLALRLSFFFGGGRIKQDY
jgi:hypothetical protein